MAYTKEEAIKIAKDFLQEVHQLEKKYGMSFNSDTGDIYLSFQILGSDKIWDSVQLDWDGGKMIIIEKTKEELRKEALSKLTPEDIEILGLNESYDYSL